MAFLSAIQAQSGTQKKRVGLKGLLLLYLICAFEAQQLQNTSFVCVFEAGLYGNCAAAVTLRLNFEFSRHIFFVNVTRCMLNFFDAF